jgi:phospholipid transport system substrate-binding protein
MRINLILYMRMMLVALLLSMQGVVYHAPAFADGDGDGELSKDVTLDFVQAISDEILLLLDDDSMTSDDYFKKIRHILNDNMDMNVIGRFLLGRYARTISDDDFSEYSEILQDYVVYVYGERLRSLNGIRISVEDSAPHKRNTYVVSTRVLYANGQAPSSLNWRLYHKNGEIRIVDIILENISMVSSQREEFTASIYQQGGDIKKFLNIFRAQVEKFKNTKL